MDIAVIGAGLAGLTAATLAAEAGAHVVLMERSGAPGGRARSRAVRGQAGQFMVNMGPHAMYEGGGGAALLDRLGIDRAGRPPVARGSLADVDGALVPLPQTASQILTSSLLTLRGRLQVGRVLASLGRSGPVDPAITWEAWLADHVNDASADRLLRALGRVTTYAADTDIAAATVLHQLAVGTDRGVRYVHGGWQRLVDGLLAAALDRGVVVEEGGGAASLDRLGGAFTISSDLGRRTVDAVIIAAGSPKAASDVLGNVAEPALRARLAATTPVRAACLDVTLDHLPRPDQPFALGLDQTTYASVHSLAADMAPAGGAVVHVARYLPTGPSDAHADRGMLEGLLDRLQPGWRGHVVDVRFLPSITVTHDLARSGLDSRVPVGVAPGVALAGDWVGSRGWLADAALLSAEDAVASVCRTTSAGRARTMV